MLLGRHPAIVSGGELAVFDKPELLRASDKEYRARIGKWLAEGLPVPFVGGSRQIFRDLEEYPWTRDEVEELACSVSTVRELLDALYARSLKAKGAVRWLEKTPSNIYCFDAIRRLYPEAKLIHIVRDGRDAVVSYNRREPSAFRAVARWYCATVAGIQWRGHPDYLEVRYEELVTQPVRVLRMICGFLEEPYAEEMLRPGAPYLRGPGGWRLDPAAAIQRTSVGQYREELTESQRRLFSAVGLSEAGRTPFAPRGGAAPESPLALQEHLGYPTDGLENAAPLTRGEALAHWQGYLRHRRATLKRFGILHRSFVRLRT